MGKIIRNAELYMAQKNLTIFCLALLKQGFKTGTLPLIHTMVQSFKIESDTRTSSFFSIEPDFYKVVYKCSNIIKKSSQFGECVRVAIRDIPQPKKANLTFPTFLEDKLIYFLAQHMGSLQNLQFSEDAFKKSYTKYETFLYEHIEQRRFLLFLQNFDMAVDEISLSKSMKLRKFSRDEIQELWGLVYRNFGDPSGDRCAIEELRTVCTEEPNPTPEIYSNFETVITTLKLFKSGSVMWGDFVDINLTWYYNIFTSRSYRRFGGMQYKLTKQEAECFEKFWVKYKERIPLVSSSFPTAIGRFKYSYERDRPEDKLIDIITSFEAILLKDSEKELSLRLALRTATFIGKTKNERKIIFNNMKKAYDLRSKIVHGGKKKKLTMLVKQIGVPLSEFVTQIEQYLRRCLQKLMLTRTLNSKIEKLDEMIFD